MALPTTCRAFRRTVGDIPTTIEPSQETLPSNLGPKEVLIKIQAVSLNFRDVAMLNGRYPMEVEERGIPCSDCAAEVVAIGQAVQDFNIGDHVSPIFDVTNFTGKEDVPTKGLGGDIPGVLREYAVFEDKLLVHLPKYLTWEEVSLNFQGKFNIALSPDQSTSYRLLHSPVLESRLGLPSTLHL